jgi:hypothetical protein
MNFVFFRKKGIIREYYVTNERKNVNFIQILVIL